MPLSDVPPAAAAAAGGRLTDPIASPAAEAIAPEAVQADVHEPVTPVQAVAHEAVEPDPVTGAAGVGVAARPAEPTLDDLLDHTVDTTRHFAEDPIGFGTKLGGAVAEGGGNVADATTARVRDGVRSQAEQAADAAGVDMPDSMSVEDLVETGGEVAARTADQLGAYAESKADATLDAAQDGADWAAGTAGGASDKLGASVEKTAGVAEDGADWAAGTASSATDKLGAFVGKTADAAVDATQDGADWAAETATNAFDTGGDLAEDAADAVEDVFDAAADAADDLAGAYDDAAEAASQAGEDAEDTLSDFLDNFF